MVSLMPEDAVSLACAAASSSAQPTGAQALRHVRAVMLFTANSLVDGRPAYMRNTPKFISPIGAFRLADSPRPSTLRVSAGSITPSSHRRALA